MTTNNCTFCKPSDHCFLSDDESEKDILNMIFLKSHPEKKIHKSTFNSNRLYLLKGNLDEVLNKEKSNFQGNILDNYLKESLNSFSHKKCHHFKYHSQHFEIIGLPSEISDTRKFINLMKKTKKNADYNISVILENIKHKWIQTENNIHDKLFLRDFADILHRFLSYHDIRIFENQYAKIFIQEIEEKENAFLGIKKSSPQNFLSNASFYSFSRMDLKNIDNDHKKFMETTNKNLEHYETNSQMIEIPKEELKIPLKNINVSETDILRRFKKDNNYGTMRNSIQLRNIKKGKSSLPLADENILLELSPSSRGSISPNRSFYSNLESPCLKKTKQPINFEKHQDAWNTDEKKEILDMVQKAKYVLINIFYLSHYNKVMNFILPSSKRKLNKLRDLESSNGLSPIFRQIQRGESPRHMSFSQEMNFNLNSQIIIDNNNNMSEVSNEYDDNDIDKETETELINDLRIIKRNERNLKSDQGRKMMFLKRSSCLANSKKIIEKRKEIFEKYLVWKMKKWSNMSKILKKEQTKKTLFDNLICCKICGKDVVAINLKTHSVYCKRYEEAKQKLGNNNNELELLTSKFYKWNQNFHIKLILKRNEVEKLRKRMKELKNIFYFPENILSIDKLVSFSLLDFDETFENKILTSKTDLIENSNFKGNLIDDFEEFEKIPAINTLYHIGNINIIHPSNHSKKNVLDLSLKTKDDLEEIRKKIKRVQKFNGKNFLKNQDYFSISMNFLNAYEDYRNLKKLSSIYQMINQICAVKNSNNKMNEKINEEFFLRIHTIYDSFGSLRDCSIFSFFLNKINRLSELIKCKRVLEQEINLLEDQYFSNEISFKQRKLESSFNVKVKPCFDEEIMTPKTLPSQKKFKEDTCIQLSLSNRNSPRGDKKKSTFFQLKELKIKLAYSNEENQTFQREKNMETHKESNDFQEINFNNTISDDFNSEKENEIKNDETLNEENSQKRLIKKKGYCFDDMDISNFNFFLLKSDEKMNIRSFSLSKIEDDLNKSKSKQQNDPNINIHDFQFIKIIGKGAFGKVYLVKRKATEDYYAMKMVNFAEKPQKNHLNSLKKEKEIFSLVEGDFVIKAHFTFTYEYFICFVMEYLKGGDLSSLIGKLSRFDNDLARFFIAELILAVSSLHDHNIIHRDLKPENILLDSTGHIKLIDFGLSEIGAKKVINDKIKIDICKPESSNKILNNPRKSNITKKKFRIIGTPDYIAPEILLRKRMNHPNLDWWSIGVILFEFLVGIPPFNDDSVEGIFNNILNRRIPWDDIEIGYGEDAVTPEAKNIIDRFLDPNPETRLGSNGIDEIKNHSFFKGMDWQNIRISEAPYKPPINEKDLTDTKNFEKTNKNLDKEILPNFEHFEKLDQKNLEKSENREIKEAIFYIKTNDFTLKRVDLLFDENNKQVNEKIEKKQKEIDEEINKLEEEEVNINQFQKIFGDEDMEGISDLSSKDHI